MVDLTRYIRDLIQKNGPLPVNEFMALALGHPAHGYYMKQDPFGAAGDFTTAPEISQIFGEMIGMWGAHTWLSMGSPERVVLLECGPGRGTLMADILRSTKNVPGFHSAVQVHLLEMSPVLKDKQKDMLESYDPHWHEGLDSVPGDGPTIVVANEFLDALPVRQIVQTPDGPQERMVDIDGGELCFRPAGRVLAEPAPARDHFIRQLCTRLRQATGAALLIDYGYEKAGPGDTLQALHKHEYCDVLEHIGDSDITAHVNFEAVKNIAGDMGMAVHGPAGQGAFLHEMGIGYRVDALKAQNPEYAVGLDSALHRLTAQDQMGTLFKVMGIGHGFDFTKTGFAV